HKKYITGCALDSQGAVVTTERRLPPVLETVLGWLAPVGQPAAVALEATLYWAWLHDRLTAAGYQVAVAHPQQVKLICHARCKTDPVDARKLADLLRTDLLPAIWIPDAETRARRTLLRGRAWVVRTRTRVKARAGRVCGAGAEHAELGWEDGPRLGRPGGECLAQVVVRRSGANAEAAARPGAQPVRAVAPGQGEAEGDRGGGAQALLLRLLDDEGRSEL